MGVNSSTNFASLKDNPLLVKFVSTQSISYNDPFWNTLLSYTSKVPQTSSDSRLLDESIENLFKQLVNNCSSSGNLSTLVKVYIARIRELLQSEPGENDVMVWQTHNALFIIRVISKLLLEQYSEKLTIELLEHPSSADIPPASLSELLKQLCSSLVYLPITPTTHPLLMESVTTLIVLLSGHVTQKEKPLYEIFSLLPTSLSAPLVQTLFQIIIQRPPPPPPSDASSSFVSGLAAGLWSVLTLGLTSTDEDSSLDDGSGQSQTKLHKLRPPQPIPGSPLADQCLLFLLALATHPSSSTTNLPNNSETRGETNHNKEASVNVFKSCILSIVNGNPTDCPREGSIPISYPALFESLTLTLHTEHTILFLYLLLSNKTDFSTYLLSAVSGVERVVSPLLASLHHAAILSSHHVYMALILILILTEDAAFTSMLHDIPLSSAPSWYQGRQLPMKDFTLGDLVVLILIKTITYNISKIRDRYLHSNCLAAFANMSSQVRRLSDYVCQRLVSLLETLAKRHERISATLRTQQDDEDLATDLSVVEEVLRMVLEIINSCLCHQMAHNPALLYTLLYKRQIFSLFGAMPHLSDVCRNIDTILGFLMNRLETETNEPAVEDVQRVIEEGVIHLPKERLRKFPELKFMYVEESCPEDFFVPYVWTLIYQSSGLFWHSNRIILFENPTLD